MAKDGDSLDTLESLDGIGASRAKSLERAGFSSPEDLLDVDLNTLTGIEGIGRQTAQRVIMNLRASQDRLMSPDYYFNRELSELKFQKRVLNEALDDRNPLLERVKFLEIFTNNMDEFFMKRIGGLKQQIAAQVTDITADGRTPTEQWKQALDMAIPMFKKQANCYRHEIRPALADAGIRIVDYDDLNAGERENVRDYFEDTIFPILTPLTFDPAHPFPHISNLSLSLAVLTQGDQDEEPRFSRVKIPPNFPRLVQVNNKPKFVPLEKVVGAHLDQLFPDIQIKGHWLFRVTRNAEVRRNEEVAEDLIEMIEEVLRERRFATVVRLDVESDMPDFVRELLMDKLGVKKRELFELDGRLDYRGFMDLMELERPDLKLEPWTPQPHPRFQNRETLPSEDHDPKTIFQEIKDEDILVHHPYHSFDKTIHRLLQDAAEDPNVLAIKAAIYRTATESKVIDSLIQAAQNGKQVAVMVELKARFDEENNLQWVERLEDEGIHVAYGTIGYKTHTKTSLIVRQDEDNETVRLYSHIGTGNYHSETAKTYEDLGLVTADRRTGQELTRLFNYFTGHSKPENYENLMIAPVNMRERFYELIQRESKHSKKGGDGRIIAKMNNLEDPDIIRELYRASQAGVSIDLIVRTICRLRPGVEGISENIRVHSVVGRFLEHSRIFYFGNNGDPDFFLGSADWMTRNLSNRVEAVTPIENETIQEKLKTIFDLILNDNRRRWVLKNDGGYEQQTPPVDEETIDVHEQLMRRARNNAL
jgi:polyphosphate kinase